MGKVLEGTLQGVASAEEIDQPSEMMRSAATWEVGSASVHLGELAAGADRNSSELTVALQMMVDTARRNAESAREACRGAEGIGAWCCRWRRRARRIGRPRSSWRFRRRS
ncbi:MAG: hypothetical protein C4321_08475 [Chloroflexota bacterium]